MVQLLLEQSQIKVIKNIQKFALHRFRSLKEKEVVWLLFLLASFPQMSRQLYSLLIDIGGLGKLLF